jgi:putative Holliday junction resolvase
LTWATGSQGADVRDMGAGQLSRAPAGRALGLDLGSQRIGVAVSDDGRRVASPLSVLARGGSHAEDHIGVGGIVAETGANVVVVGLPLSLNGREGPAATAVKAEVEELRMVLDVPVECSDERFTTVVAHQALAAGGGRRPAARRSVVDKVAAAAILQTWLDRQRALTAPAPAELGTIGPETEDWPPLGADTRRLPRRAH